MKTQENRFFEALRDIFVGAKVEGESGFVNLMHIKSRYYEQGVFPRLKEDIDRALEPFPEFREELFERLYTFFRRYFSESGSIYFRFTPPHEHVYEKVYTDDRDVALFWKTHMLYYVKTDRLFHSMGVEVDGFRFFFDVSTLEHKQANERREPVYAFQERREDGTLVFTVAYSERGRKTNVENIRRAVRDALGQTRYTATVPAKETLERAFRLFERQSEVDYFVNKNARRFLQEQFNLWLYQYVFEPEERQGTLWTERRIRQLQVLKEIAYKIIDFLAQFEDELVRIWNKPKFVLGSHYIITLDRIVTQEGGVAMLERLLAHPGMEAQLQEWRNLGMVDENFTSAQIWATESMDRLHERYQYLPVDTQHFPDLEMAIVGLFDHLDRQLDGWLVHSENYQALNTMLPKFAERIRCVYIDPPYNTGNDEFLYRDRYQRASWLTMMSDRLILARRWMSQDGAIFVSIDDNQHDTLWLLMRSIWGDENAITSMVWEGGLKNDSRFISVSQDYIVVFVKDIQHLSKQDVRWRVRKEGIDDIYAYVDNLKQRYGTDYERISEELKTWYTGLPRSHPAKKHRHYNMVDEQGVFFAGDISAESGRSREPYEVQHPVTGKPCKRPLRNWPTRETMNRWISEGRILWGPDETYVPKLKRYLHETEGQVLWPVFYKDRRGAFQQLRDIIGSDFYANPKDPGTLEKLIEAAGGPNCFVLDFFAGSGTTAHAVINLNRHDGGQRKYILVEMADYFDTLLLPRIKKVIFSNLWRGGKAQIEGKGIGHFVKYFHLEQYEKVLRVARYRDDDKPLFYQDPYSQYVFLRDPKLLDNAETNERVFEVNGDETQLNLERLYPDIDLAESLSCVTGRWIRRIHPDPEDPARPGAVEFEDGTKVDLRTPPWDMVKPLVWW
ncbi:MAG: site-specific DNA-methyltransferase [Candidatus Micrarchaeaceae archaeon]